MKKVQPLFDWALGRLNEASTWRGIVLLLTSAGITVNPEKAHNIIAAGLLIVGGINILRKEKNGATKDDLSELMKETAKAIKTGDTTALAKKDIKA